MPNWTYNKVVLRDDASFNAIVECMRGEDEGYPTEFDFNRIKECPEILSRCNTQYETRDMAACVARELGCTGKIAFDDAAAWLKTKYPNLSIDDQKRSVGLFDSKVHKVGAIGVDEILAICEASEGDLSEADADNGLVCIEARIGCGTTSGYEWRCHHWGVKWNATSVYVDKKERSIRFTTPWSPVVDLMLEMCEKFHVDAYYCYDEEQTDVCYGQWWFDADGDIVESDTPGEFDYDMFCIAADLTDPEQDYIRWNPDENKVWYHFDDDEGSDAFYALPTVSDTTTQMLRDFLDNRY